MAKEFCTVCGTKNEGSSRFCTGCGADLQEEIPAVQPVYQQPAAQTVAQPIAQPVNQPAAIADGTAGYVPGNDSPYEPVTAGGYIGSMMLMALPLLGFILTIIWACGGCRKINKRNLARAYLILMIIGAVLGIVLFIIFRVAFAQYF